MERDVPYIVFEGEMARHERTIKRLVTLLILTIALLFVSNVAWLWFFNQFDISGETVSVENSSESATPATTPAPQINVQNANLTVTRIA